MEIIRFVKVRDYERYLIDKETKPNIAISVLLSVTEEEQLIPIKIIIPELPEGDK